VAAVLLGAKEAYAVDIDPQALIATIDNAQKNNASAENQGNGAQRSDDF
jgi:ribosomal protein L11 methyltransferase